MRELKSQVDSLKSEKMRNELEKELRAKAKELGYPVDRAGRFSIYGDKAFSMLENEAEYLKSIVSDSLETEIKSRFGGETPKNGETKKTELTRAEYDNLTNAQKADFVKNGGKIK